MHIVIPDEYQDAIERLACYSLLDGHDVTRYREPAASFEELVERLRPADVIVAIRERVTFDRALIERLPNLKLIALVGRNATTIDYAACTEHGVMVSRGESNSPTSPAELTVALIARLAPQHRHRSGTDAPRRMAVHAVAPSARFHARDFRSRQYRLAGGPGRGGAGNEGAGLGTGATPRSARAELGYDVAASKAALFEQSDVLSLHVRLRPDTSGIVGPGGSGAHETDGADRQYIARRTDPARRVARGVARGTARLRRRRCV